MATIVSESAFTEVSGTTLETAAFSIGGTNRCLWVGVGNGDGTPVAPSAVKFGGSGGTDLTQLGSTLNFTSYGRYTLWRLSGADAGGEPSSSNLTVHATWPSAQGERWIIAIASDDVDQTTPNQTVASATGTGSPATVNATSTAGQTVIDFVANLDVGGTGALGDDVPDVLESVGGTYEAAGGSRETAAGASTTCSWTITGGGGSPGWAMFALAINEDAGGGGGGSGYDIAKMFQYPTTLLRM